MSAAADEPQMSAARVSVVASIGYTAFLAGPPLIGFLGDEVGVLRALTVTAGAAGPRRHDRRKRYARSASCEVRPTLGERGPLARE